MTTGDEHPMTDLRNFKWTINESWIREEKSKKYHTQYMTPHDEINHHVSRIIDKLWVKEDREA